jgi:uncharacterized protein YukE
MDNLEVNPDQFASNGGSFTQVGDEAGSIGSGMVNGIRLQGAWYGTDKFGKVFSSSFNPGVDQLGDAINSFSAAFNNTGEGLKNSAKLYVQADEETADSIPDLSSSPPHTAI